jgi:hypothetical protein
LFLFLSPPKAVPKKRSIPAHPEVLAADPLHYCNERSHISSSTGYRHRGTIKCLRTSYKSCVKRLPSRWRVTRGGNTGGHGEGNAGHIGSSHRGGSRHRRQGDCSFSPSNEASPPMWTGPSSPRLPLPS